MLGPVLFGGPVSYSVGCSAPSLGECTATKNVTVESQAKEYLAINSDLIIDGEKFMEKFHIKNLPKETGI